jgi:hypothetical protein
MVLPPDELAFYFAAAGQLAPELRPVFAERVAGHLAACPCPGAGDVDRAVRAALDGLWTPPVLEHKGPRWGRRAPGFDRASRRDW